MPLVVATEHAQQTDGASVMMRVSGTVVLWRVKDFRRRVPTSDWFANPLTCGFSPTCPCITNRSSDYRRPASRWLAVSNDKFATNCPSYAHHADVAMVFASCRRSRRRSGSENLRSTDKRWEIRKSGISVGALSKTNHQSIIPLLARVHAIFVAGAECL